MVDSHCHLTTSPLYDNLSWELEQFTKKGGQHILNVATSLNSIQQAIKLQHTLSTTYPNLSYLAIGLHPENFLTTTPITKSQGTLKDCISQIEAFTNIVKENIEKISALGETGLDYHQLINTDSAYLGNSSECIEIQKLSFRQHLELAIEYDLPLTIHCRENHENTECIRDTLQLISEIGNGSIRGVIHSYTGSLDFVQDILDLGLYIGFNAIVTYKSGENIRDILRKTPLDRILLETDAPLLPLRNEKKKYGSPVDILKISGKVSKVLKLPVKKILSQTTQNFKELFLIQ